MSTSLALPEGFDPDRLDLISGEKFEREGYPHAEWAWLRRNDPVRYFEPEGCDPFWAITKYKDIVKIGKNPKDWISEPRFAVLPLQEMPEDLSTRHLLTMDPPDHGRYRNLISKAFTPRSVQIWEPKIQAITRRVLDRASEKGVIDFVADVSAPITIEVIALMLGVPESDWHLLFGWTNEIIAPGDPDNQTGTTTQETFDRARNELFTYFKEIAEKRRVDPTGDIISQIVQGKIDGVPLNDFELLSYFLLLVVAGNETTRNAMTAGIQCFLDNPEQWNALVEDTGLVEGAIEETVRWATPVIQFARTATCDQTIRDKHIREGDSVCLFYASANRDEEIFDDPFSFRIDRWPNDHIGFGRGEHVCLGAHLARLEIRAMYQQLSQRLVEMERLEPVTRVRSGLIGGVKRAPMKWALRAAT
jgi:cholest-4-en-3-one 26-monooxygenase